MGRLTGQGVTALVTGFSGYLGSRLCHELLNQGCSVKSFDLKHTDTSSLPTPADGGGSLQIVHGDVTDYPWLREASSGCHVIFHAAAIVEVSMPKPESIFSVNIGGLKKVLKAYKESKTIKKIVYTSSFLHWDRRMATLVTRLKYGNPLP